ncbi:MAG: hypothetical protein FJ271_00795 [Planctomycetes bacterium]|nr:hypothetical protein [Planctomycetota bacterium]
MLWWLVDNATVVYLVLGLTALVLAAVFWSNRRVKFLAAAGVLLGLVGLFFLLTRLIVTDREQLYLHVQAMARGVEEGDPEKVFRHFSKQFRHDNSDGATARARIAAAIRARRVSAIGISSFDAEQLSRADRKARVTFLVSFDADGHRHMFRARLEFALEGDDWRLTRVQLFNPVVNHDQPIAIPM